MITQTLLFLVLAVLFSNKADAKRRTFVASFEERLYETLSGLALIFALGVLVYPLPP